MTADDAVTRHLVAGPAPERLHELADLLDLPAQARRGVLHVLDVGANPLDDVPVYLPLLDQGLARVTGFEPQPDAFARLVRCARPDERYLPWALGDGTVQELRVCAAEGFSGLLEPDPEQLAVLTDFPRLAAVTARSPVPTRRLDDVAAQERLGRVDLLAMDAQGSELQILEHGAQALEGLLAAQVEVSFHRLYEHGPVLGEVDRALRGLGLVPHAFVSTRTWPLAPIPWADPLQARARHLVEADMLYLLDPARWGGLDDDSLRRLVLTAAAAYGEVGTGLVALRHLVGRGTLGPAAEPAYRRWSGADRSDLPPTTG